MMQDEITGGKIWQPEAEPNKLTLHTDDPVISMLVKQTFVSIMGISGVYLLIRFFPEISEFITQLVRLVGGVNA